MALENEILVGRFNRLLQRLFSMKGPVPSPQLGGDINAGIELEVDRPEWGFLSGEMRFAGWFSQAAVAAQVSEVGLQLNLKSGVIVVVEQIIIDNSSAGALEFEVKTGTGAPLTGLVSMAATDQRFGTKKTAVQIGSSTEAVATPANRVVRVSIPANSSLILAIPAILASADPAAAAPQIIVATIAANTAITAVGFIGRERGIEPSENLPS